MKSAILSCIVTGREKKFYSLTLKSKCKKYGSLDEFRQFYVCREAIKLLKARIQPEDVQKQLLARGKKPFDIDFNVLARLKLLKRKKKELKNEVDTTLHTSRWKVAEIIKKTKHFTTKKAYVEWLTGGPEKSQISVGGTCWHTDYRISNGGFCDGCDFAEHCLCRLRKVKK